MTGGEKLLVVGAAGLGIVAILKFKQNNPSQISPPVGASNINPQFDMSGIGAAGPLGAPLAVLQPGVKAGIDALNKGIGGANPYAGLTKQADGSYKDGLGASYTFNADGTYTRKNPSWKQTNGGKIIYGTGSAVVNAFKSVGSIF